MNTQSVVGNRIPVVSGPESLREIWGFLMDMGIALMLLGIAAIGSSLIATFATVLVFGKPGSSRVSA
jgi:uncharacterized membrane protein HdeD (DUF308 family)